MRAGGIEHHSLPMQAYQRRLKRYFCYQNIFVLLCACSIQAIEDADNLKIAKSLWAGDQKQKYDL